MLLSLPKKKKGRKEGRPGEGVWAVSQGTVTSSISLEEHKCEDHGNQRLGLGVTQFSTCEEGFQGPEGCHTDAAEFLDPKGWATEQG